MPTYDYTCSECGHRMEAFQKITDAPLSQCPACLREMLTRGPGGGIGLQFTGTGFYKTMYGNAETPAPTPTPSDKTSCCPCGKNANSCNSQ